MEPKERKQKTIFTKHLHNIIIKDVDVLISSHLTDGVTNKINDVVDNELDPRGQCVAN